MKKTVLAFFLGLLLGLRPVGLFTHAVYMSIILALLSHTHIWEGLRFLLHR